MASELYIIREENTNMKNYVSPVIFDNEELAEGVYATGSGAGIGCYNIKITEHQKPETGRGDFRFQVDAHHSADHNGNRQIMVITFNQNDVEYQSSSGSVLAGYTSGKVIKIEYAYTQNPTDNIGLGNIVVTANVGVSIEKIDIECYNGSVRNN